MEKEKELKLFTEDVKGERTARQQARRAKIRQILFICFCALAAALAIAFIVTLTACSNNNQTVVTPTKAPDVTEVVTETPTEVPTPEPTEAPTEVPTEEPTPEPTATPVPHMTDPTGHVPEDVEIICFEKNNAPFWTVCVAKKDDGYYVQNWSNKELKAEICIPDEMVEEIEYVYLYTFSGDNSIVETMHTDGTCSVYLETPNGSLILRGHMGWEDDWQEILVEHNVVVAVDVTWDSYYYKETFSEDVDLEFDTSYNSWVDKKTGHFINFNINDKETEKIKF